MGINLPEYSKLDHPHKIEGNQRESKKKFYELALSRIRYSSEEEHYQFEKDVYGDDWKMSSAMYVVSRNNHKTEKNEETFINALDISINKDWFYIGEEDYTDLIPYAVEHEIYESCVRNLSVLYR